MTLKYAYIVCRWLKQKINTKKLLVWTCQEIVSNGTTQIVPSSHSLQEAIVR